MKWEEKVGSGYTDRLDDIAIVIGSTMYTRRELVNVAGNGNFIAAMALSSAFDRLRPKGLDEVFHKYDQWILREQPGVWTTAIYVLCRILDANGYDVDWWLSQDYTDARRRRRKHKKRSRRR